MRQSMGLISCAAQNIIALQYDGWCFKADADFANRACACPTWKAESGGGLHDDNAKRSQSVELAPDDFGLNPSRIILCQWSGNSIMTTVWKTKYGTRRVRFDPPTLKEAITAARGLTDDVQQQAEIAAALMEVPVEDVRAELLASAPPRNSTQIVTANGREGAARTVIVERKTSRRAGSGVTSAAIKAGLLKRP